MPDPRATPDRAASVRGIFLGAAAGVVRAMTPRTAEPTKTAPRPTKRVVAP